MHIYIVLMKLEHWMCLFFRAVTFMEETVEKEKLVLPHHPVQHQHYTHIHPGIKSTPLSEEIRKAQLQPNPSHKILCLEKKSPSPKPAPLDMLKPKPQHPNHTQSNPYPTIGPADLPKAKPHPGLFDISKPKPNTSPEISKHKIQRYPDSSPPPPGRLSSKVEAAETLRSSFKLLQSRSESGGRSTPTSTKSPLIIDKNETFTVYRDPALVRSDAENSSSVSTNHVAAYLHPHLHPLPSSHSACLTSSSHPHATPHLLAPAPTSTLPHPHLLPPGVLPAMHPPSASLLGGHPRLDSPNTLGHLTLTHQQQFLQVCIHNYNIK